MSTLFLKFLLLFYLFIEQLSAQSSVVLYGDRDTYINSVHPDMNYADQYLVAAAWTVRSQPTVVRSIFDFDWSSIPDDVSITKALLSLYGGNSKFDGNHSTSGGSNEAEIFRLTSDWDERSVTWNIQPTYSIENKVFLIESVLSEEDYLNIDVTGIVQDMVNSSSESFGFMLKLIKEEYYRRLVFVPSNHPDKNLYPKLEIWYTE